MIKECSNYAKSFAQLVKHRFFKTDAPLFVALGITNRCNYRCVYCYGDYYNQKKENFSTQELLNIIDELKQMGALIINLIGGEPLLRDDIKVFIERIKRHDLICHLSSNASLIHERISDIKEIDALDTSLDGLKENNDKNRGQGTYEKTMKGIEYAVSHGIKTNVNMVLTRYNIDDVDTLLKMACDIGFSLSFNLAFESHSCEHTNYKDSFAIKNDRDDSIKECLKKIVSFKKKGYPIRFLTAAYDYALAWPQPYNQSVFIDYKEALRDFRPLKCYFRRFHCYIDPDGRICNCMHIKDSSPVFNVREFGVKGAWQKISTFKHPCLACYTICNNNANLIFSLKPKAILAAITDSMRGKL